MGKEKVRLSVKAESERNRRVGGSSPSRGVFSGSSGFLVGKNVNVNVPVNVPEASIQGSESVLSTSRQSDEGDPAPSAMFRGMDTDARDS